MMQRPLFLIFLLLTSLFHTIEVAAQADLERMKVTKEISMLVPTGFVPMSQADLFGKYVSFRAPIAMFTSQDRRIDLGINQNSSPWSDGDLNILMEFYKAGLLNLFNEIKFYREEIRTIGNRDFVVFEFTSKVTDEDATFGGLSSPISNYTYIMYTIYNNRVLLFNFTSPANMRAQWQAPAHEIMESVRIK